MRAAVRRGSLGCTDAHSDGLKPPLLQPLQAAGPERIDPFNANVRRANVVETDGAQSSGQNETVDGEVENMLRSVSDLIKTSEGSNTSGRPLLSLAPRTVE